MKRFLKQLVAACTRTTAANRKADRQPVTALEVQSHLKAGRRGGHDDGPNHR